MKRWELKDIEFLKRNYKKLSYLNISKRLNKSLNAIYWKTFELNLKKGRWNRNNRLSKNKVINLLIKQKVRLGKSPSIREIPISLKSACQRHFGNFNNAKKAAHLEIKDYIKTLSKKAYKPSEELAYITGLLLGDGSFRYQKSKERTSYVIIFGTKDKDLMDYFRNKFMIWSGFNPKVSMINSYYRKFPNGITSYCQKSYNTQISSKQMWAFLKKFKDNPLLCLSYFPKKYYRWLIKGLWDAEGCIRTTKTKSLRIHFSNSNMKIIELYIKILKNFDLPYSIHSNKNKTFNVDILKKSKMLRFIKLINGITIKRKTNKSLNKMVNNFENKNINFKDKVYSLVKKIPFGYISTYREVANALNTKAYRAVGNALNKNPYKNVPCHRIVGSNSHLTGFASGLKNKSKLLKKEGINIKNNKVLDIEKVFYKF